MNTLITHIMVNFKLKSKKESNNECCINTKFAKESIKNFGVYMNITDV